MARKTQTTADVSKLDTILFNWLGYWARIKRTLIYGAFYIVLIAVVALLTTWAIVGSPPSVSWLDTLKSTTGAATGVIQTVEFNNNDVEAVPTYTEVPDPTFETIPFSEVFFCIYLIEAVLIALLGMVFSGWYAKVFLTPVNPLKFASFAILESDRISFRFWICLPSEVFLYNVSVELSYVYEKRYDTSVIFMSGESDSIDDRTRFHDAANPTHIQTERFLSLRGVWRVTVPLGTDASSKLLSRFKDLSERKRNPVFKLLVQGETESGEIVAREMRYNRLRLLSDYRFAVYHDREHESDKPVFSNFNKICLPEEPCEANDKASESRDVRSLADPIGHEYVEQHANSDLADEEYKKWIELLATNKTKLECTAEGREKLQAARKTIHRHFVSSNEVPSLANRVRNWWLTIHS